MSTNTFFTVCPHCGYKSEDDEMCQACGVLFNTPDDVSIFEALLEGLSAFAKGILGHPRRPRRYNYKNDPMSDPGWSLTAGNLYNHDYFEIKSSPPPSSSNYTDF